MVDVKSVGGGVEDTDGPDEKEDRLIEINDKIMMGLMIWWF